MPRPIECLNVDDGQRKELTGLIRRSKTPQRMVTRAKIVLLRGEGKSQEQTADELNVSRVTVSHWEKRFSSGGVAGLNEAQRSGRKPTLPDGVKQEIIVDSTRPPVPMTRWSLRTMAKSKGVSPSTVHKLWKANDIKPHLIRTFKVSSDPQFEYRFWDVVGLYLAPPERALVLCCDEKSQCQALERTQPGLPLGVGDIRTKTHDYTRHGTITLFAALEYLSGQILRRTAENHTHVEWLDFLKHIDRSCDDGLSLHLIVDNYATHKHPKVLSWIKWRNQRHGKRHGIQRIKLHFTPTSSSWLNMVERFFRDITEDVIRDGSFSHINELIDSIEAYMRIRDRSPKRYVWRAEGEKVLAKIHRAKKALESNNNA